MSGNQREGVNARDAPCFSGPLTVASEIIKQNLVNRPSSVGEPGVNLDEDTELAKKAPLSSQINTLVAREKGGNAGFSEGYRTGVNVVLESGLARHEVDKVSKHIVAEYIDVRRIGQGAGLRWEIVRSELLYLCNADSRPCSL